MIEVLNFANITTPSFNEERRNYLPYIKYGDNNLFPQEMIFYSNKSTTHTACLKLIKKAISGSGYTTASNDSNLSQFLKDLDYNTDGHSFIEKLSSQMGILNGYIIEIIWNNFGDKIASIKPVPLQYFRIAHTDEYDCIQGFYFNSDWERYPSNYSEFIPRFDPEKSLTQKKQILYMYLKSENSRVYPVPEYSTALNYIAMEYEIGIHHLSSAMNSFLPSNLITVIGDSEPTDEQRNLYTRKFNQTKQGSQNSGKSILHFAETADQKIIIDPIQVDNVVDHYIQASQECRTNIIVANSILTPGLLGLSDNSQAIFSNGDELLSAWNLFENFTIRTYQKLIEDGMNIILEYSGFDNPGFSITPFQLNPEVGTNIDPVIDPVTQPTDQTQQIKQKKWYKKIW